MPGTSFRLDPVKAAWDIGCIVRWLDYNDTWLAAEWGHPSDNLGGILAVADHLSQKRLANGEAPLSMRQVLEAMIMAHEIQGVIALENSFNRVGLDHVLLVKVASTAVCAKLMGADREQLLAALSHAFVDGQALRTYRHAPNAGSRKSWAAGDRDEPRRAPGGHRLARRDGHPRRAQRAAMGFLRCPVQPHQQGPGDQARGQAALQLPQGYGSYVMENVLFKISFPPNSTRRPPPRPPCACIRW